MGQTEKEALERLKSAFGGYKKYRRKIPRPGSSFRLVKGVAPSHKVEKYQGLVNDFFTRVMGEEYAAGFDPGEKVLPCDIINLRLFEPNDAEQARQQRAAIIRRTLEIYGVDISAKYDAQFGKLFAYLDKKRRKHALS